MRPTLAPILAACLAVFAAAPRADDVAPGREQFTTCASCHGQHAQGNRNLGAPRLNYLTPVYITAQLEKFRNGQRGGDAASKEAQSMATMAKTLPDEQALIDVAEYIASLDSPPSPVTVDGDPELGEDYYGQLCGACHGAGAVGNQALRAPPLAGGDDWYLRGQLLAFRDGRRGYDPNDRTGRQMRAMAATLPDTQAVNDVVSYLRALGEEPASP